MPSSAKPPSSKGPSPSLKKPTIFHRIWFNLSGLGLWNKVAILLLLLSVPTVFAVLTVVKPLYKSWKVDNNLKIAAAAIEQDDYNAATVAFRTAIRTRPTDPKVWRAVAQFMDLTNSPEAVSLWRRVTVLDPRDVDARLKLAAAYTRAGRVSQAMAVMATIPEGARKSADFFRVQADIAMAAEDQPAAETALQNLLAVTPDDEKAKWDLVRVQMVDRDREVRQVAIERIREYSEKEGEFQAEALRQLIRLYAAQNDHYTANRLAEKLIALPTSAITDRTIHLDTEYASQSFTLLNSQKALLAFVEQNPETAGVAVNYLISKGEMGVLERWFEKMPPEVASNSLITAARFDFELKNRDWDDVYSVIESGNLPFVVTPELAEKARAGIEKFRAGDATAISDWKEAVYISENNPSATKMLKVLAGALEWRQAMLISSRALANTMGLRPDLWADVLRIEVEDRNTPGILSALTSQLKADPEDRDVRNDWILMSMLINHDVPKEMLDLAKANYEADPKNPFFIATYGWALARSEQAEKAVEVIETLPEEDRLNPDKSLYIGAIYSLAGENEKALEALARSVSAVDRGLPEEKRLYADSISLAKGEVSKEELLELMTERHQMSDEELDAFLAIIERKSAEEQAEQVQATLDSLRLGLEQSRPSTEDVSRIIDEVRAPLRSTQTTSEPAEVESGSVSE